MAIRKFLHFLVVALLSLPHTEASGGYPNIIFILADDAGYNDFGWAGDDFVGITDTLDSLKNEGIEIAEYYTQQQCTPSRASLLTGRYPFGMGMQEDSISSMSAWGLPLEYTLLPQYLAELGYESHGIGKWHLGHAYEQYLPHHRGFLSFYGYLSSSEHYRTHLLNDGLPYLDFIELWSSSDTIYADHTGSRAEAGAQCVKNKDGIQSSTLYTDRIISIAKQWNESGGKDAGIPLFIYAAYQNPHTPLEPDPNINYSNIQNILDKIDDTARYGNAQLMYEFDQEVKRLISGLKSNGAFENYILIFASDNGPCKISGGSQYPLRGSKLYTFEGGSRTRAFIKSSIFNDSVVKSKYSELFHVSDWLPTLMDAVSPGWSLSDAASDLDGVSHWRAFFTNNYGLNPRKEVVYNLQKSSYHEDSYYLYGAIRVGDWKLVLNERCQLWVDFYGRFDDDIYQSQCEYKELSCVMPNANRTYLFNLMNDPSEVRDLKAEHPDHFTALLRRLKEYESMIKDPVSDIGNGEESSFIHAYMRSGCIVPFLHVRLNHYVLKRTADFIFDDVNL